MLNDGYQHRRHNRNLLLVHLVLVTKYRKPILVEGFRMDVMRYIFDACVRHHWYIRRMETDRDHVHILLQYAPTDSVTAVVSVIKQLSTWKAWKEYGSFLSQHYWREHTLWSDGYFAASVGTVSVTAIERYIENQG